MLADQGNMFLSTHSEHTGSQSTLWMNSVARQTRAWAAVIRLLKKILMIGIRNDDKIKTAT